jgi:hypothetical protein
MRPISKVDNFLITEGIWFQWRGSASLMTGDHGAGLEAPYAIQP